MVGLRTRIWTAATTPAVRTIGPTIANIAKTFTQFVACLLLGCLALLLPTPTVVATILTGIIVVLAVLVVWEQVRITYSRPKEIVYPNVEAFPDREPK